MSWNPTPTVGSASWSGNPPLATKNQLLSTSSGLYEDLKDFNFSTISVSTLTVPIWISTPLLYVSDIIGANVDISGITINQDGVFNAPIVSLSSMNLKGFDNLLGLDVSFDFGLGNAIGGFLGGLGALVGGATIAVGTGVGLAIQGAEQGIATMVAGRPQNFLNSNVYETINFTSQLQVSTLGNAYPLYSSIFRTVSTNFPDQEPGKEIFVSTFFSPGQICIRSASDPFNLISGDSNLNTSTIQSFGQWVPLEGLEPENIVANSVSTQTLSTVELYATVATVDAQQSYDIVTTNIGVASNLSMNYDADIYFTTGSGTAARLVGTLQNLYFQTDDRFIFSQLFTSVENASLDIGSNAHESLLTVSSIYSQGNIQANTGFFSTLTVESLIVVSSLSTIFEQSTVTSISTGVIEADLIFARDGFFSTIGVSTLSQFSFQSPLGNPLGPFDINKVDTVVSTSYNQVSSLTQNILSYSLNETINDQTIWEPPARFTVYPGNVEMWASTLMYRPFTGGQAFTLSLSYFSNWTQSGITAGTFDLTIDMTQTPFYVNVAESSNAQNSQLSTILEVQPTPSFCNTYQFNLQSNGWWTYVTPAPPPPITSNNNTFQIYQDINDTYIEGTDRLHLRAGNIFFNGIANFDEVGLFEATDIFTSNITASNVIANIETVSTVNALTVNVSSLTANPNTGGLDTFYYKFSTVSFNAAPTTVTPSQMSFITQSPDFIPTFQLVPPFMGSNSFTSYNYTSWNGSIWNNTTAFSLGPPGVYVGDVQTPKGAYSAQFWINNDIVASPSYVLPVYVITSAGSNLLGNVNGSTYALIQTSNGVNWTLTPNVANPQGVVGGNFSNVITTIQGVSLTQEDHTQNFQLNAPNTTFLTGTLNLYADQIRVNSRRYGSLESAGLASFPIGIENTVYIDANIAWTYTPGNGFWQSDAANILYNINNTIFYDANSWIVQVIPSRFRTNDGAIISWDVQPAIFAVGGGGFCWGYNRYIQVNAYNTISGPGVGANNWNWVIAFPKNYCTY